MLSSPRRRRRLAWLGAAGLVVGAIGAVVVLVPNHTTQSAAPPQKTTPPKHPASSQSAHRTAPAHQTGHHAARHHGLTPADRRAINATLDQFIPDGVGQRSMATAWRLAGPELKSASTLDQWRHDSSPVPYFPVAGKTFHGWRVLDASRNSVDFDILVEPRPHTTRYGSWVFSGEMIRQDSHWLVNRFYTTAEMQPVRGSRHEIGPADFAAPPATGVVRTDKARLSGIWLLATGGMIGLAFLFPIGFGITSVVRNRRRKSGTNRALPPLPQRR